MEIQQSGTSKPRATPKWLRVVLWTLASVLLGLVIAAVSVGLYINSHKKEVLAKVTRQLNQNIDGTLSIGDLSPEFFSSFPRLSLRLSDVTLRDTQFSSHGRELLSARRVYLSLNTFALIRRSIKIRKISVQDASIQLFVDENGYSNSSVFKKSDRKSSNSFECKRFELKNVRFLAENRMKHKLHDLHVSSFEGRIDAKPVGWRAEAALFATVRNMSFNISKGSFLKNQPLEAKFVITADGFGRFNFSEQSLRIGKEMFTMSAKLDFSDRNSTFKIRLKNRKILWKQAAGLLSENIGRKLDMFGISRPINVSCNLEGDFSKAGDPLIYVEAHVRANELSTPGGTISKCGFDATFANNYNKKKPFGDENSVILLRNLSGEYGAIPFSVPVATIVNLKNPTARGKLAASFSLPKLNSVIDKDLVHFKSGKANVSVDFTADVAGGQLEKPKIVGKVWVQHANVLYSRRNLAFQDVSVNLDFNPNDLNIRNIRIKSGKSEVVMDGKVKNFLNLYYNSPENIVLNWNVYSKQLHLGEFLGYLGSENVNAARKKKTGNFTTELNELLENCQVRMAMKIDRLFYKKFEASNARAIVSVSDSEIAILKSGLSHAGGRIAVEGNLTRQKTYNRYKFKTTVRSADVSEFFKAFDNFGLQALKAENLSGKLSAEASLSGAMANGNRLLQETMDGNAAFTLQNGSLTNFEPIQKVGKIAFRRRDINNISFRDLNGKFRIEGEKIIVEPMKISSSVLNLDVEGVYSFGEGTNLRIDVPLRNPKKDDGILDQDELEKRRHRGIVLHLLASDDPDTGKVKISLEGRKEKQN